MDNNAEVMVYNFPKGWDEAEVKKFVSEKVGMGVDEVFKGIVTLKDDPRPEVVNSNGKGAIFTCQTAQIATIVIEKINENKAVMDGVKEEICPMAKLTKGMLAYMKDKQNKENREKYAESGKNIQVFNLRTEIQEDNVKEFFSRYGEIESVSCPKRTDIEPSLFHYNVLFTTQEAAEKAISKAVSEEKKCEIRLSQTELRV
jgi:hypothetical protein